jgi:hypothetical protein
LLGMSARVEDEVLLVLCLEERNLMWLQEDDWKMSLGKVREF